MLLLSILPRYRAIRRTFQRVPTCVARRWLKHLRMPFIPPSNLIQAGGIRWRFGWTLGCLAFNSESRLVRA